MWCKFMRGPPHLATEWALVGPGFTTIDVFIQAAAAKDMAATCDDSMSRRGLLNAHCPFLTVLTVFTVRGRVLWLDVGLQTNWTLAGIFVEIT